MEEIAEEVSKVQSAAIGQAGNNQLITVKGEVGNTILNNYGMILLPLFSVCNIYTGVN